MNKLSKKDIAEIRCRGYSRDFVFDPNCTCEDNRDLIFTIEALHTSINTLADQFKAQGQPSVAQEIRRLAE